MADPYTIANGEERWRARWRTGKGERQCRSGFRTEAKAVAHEERMRTARRDGKPERRPKTRMTVDEYFWEKWWPEEVTLAKSRGTQQSYRNNHLIYIAPRVGRLRLTELIDEPQLLIDWRLKLGRERGQSAVEHAQRVFSSMLSAAAEDGTIPYNPLLLLNQQGRRGRRRKVAREAPPPDPIAVDPVGWFLVMDYLRRPTRPAVKGERPRTRRYPLDREGDALIVALGFMAGFRLPSEPLGLTREDWDTDRLEMVGRNSWGEYTPGSKTGPKRDMPTREALGEVFERVERAHRDAGKPLSPTDFWIAARRDGGVWTEHQAHNWRERDFRPVARQVAADFPQYADLRKATPYDTRHTFISCCLQAGISLAVIASWCGTSIAMISQTYGRMIKRYEGAAPIPLDEQFAAAKAEAMSLLSAHASATSSAADGSTNGSTSPGRLRVARRGKRELAGLSAR